jgi:predicted GNAT family acetyltransferase
MQQATMAQSIESSGSSIGARAARHLDLVFRHMMDGQGAEQGECFLRLVTGEPHPMGNLAIISDPVNLETTRTAVGPLLGRDFPTAVLYTEAVSDAVAQSLVDQGFENHGAMPAMAVDIERIGATALPPGYEWARIGAGSDGQAWAETLAVGYGLPAALARMFSPEALGADMAPGAQVQFFGIRRNGRLVATSLLFLADGLAGIYCVATLSEERGKGLGAHVTAEALRTAHRLGYRVGILQSSDDGHSVYLGLGFADLAGVPMFVRMPA